MNANFKLSIVYPFYFSYSLKNIIDIFIWIAFYTLILVCSLFLNAKTHLKCNTTNYKTKYRSKNTNIVDKNRLYGILLYLCKVKQ